MSVGEEVGDLFGDAPSSGPQDPGQPDSSSDSWMAQFDQDGDGRLDAQERQNMLEALGGSTASGVTNVVPEGPGLIEKATNALDGLLDVLGGLVDHWKLALAAVAGLVVLYLLRPLLGLAENATEGGS